MEKYLFSLLFLFACNPSQKQTKVLEKQTYISYYKAAENAVFAWNRFHTTSKIDSLTSVYADSVWLFGIYDFPKEKCIEAKKRDIWKFCEYKQSIDSLTISTIYPHKGEEKDSNEIHANLIKKVVADKKEHRYFAYLNLVWNKQKNKYEIVHESDCDTDENLEIQASLQKQIYEVGDYNGDGKKEKMWLKKEKTTAQNILFCTIVFSDKNIPPILVEGCTGGIPKNEGDLDGDGADEISLVPDWISSNYTAMRVYFHKNKVWYSLNPPIYCRRDGLSPAWKDDYDAKAYAKMVEKGDSTHTWVWANVLEWDDNLVQDVYRRKKQKIKMEILNKMR